MPRFFFDFRDGDYKALDEVGENLPDLDSAFEAAVVMLKDLDESRVSDDERPGQSMTVRSDKGRMIFEVNHDMSTRWIE